MLGFVFNVEVRLTVIPFKAHAQCDPAYSPDSLEGNMATFTFS